MQTKQPTHNKKHDHHNKPDHDNNHTGADPHEGDRRGRRMLTWDGLEARDRRVFEWAWQRGLPLAFAMAGGYGTRIEDTVQAQVNTFKVAAQYARRWQNRPQKTGT